VQLSRLAQVAGLEIVEYSPDRSTLEALAPLGVETVPIVSAINLPKIRADARTAIVFMFHDHEWERDLIPAALATDAFYIGAVGSRATHRSRLRRLAEVGFGAAQLKRIRGPAGLFAGAKNATDIALSILAEIAQIEQATAERLLGLAVSSDRDAAAFALSEGIDQPLAALPAE
jgi:xanthine dehydrogenase accessory factor